MASTGYLSTIAIAKKLLILAAFALLVFSILGNTKWKKELTSFLFIIIVVVCKKTCLAFILRSFDKFLLLQSNFSNPLSLTFYFYFLWKKNFITLIWF
jgi:hypothetical protein